LPELTQDSRSPASLCTVGVDPLVGDGAGCFIQMPDALLLRDWRNEFEVVASAFGGQRSHSKTS